ncbi:excisionase family DNA-binding protein [Rubrivirga sp.]|uniref:excisionase family DNA-binding protein n=1 Tax=Rubrivirga sp. TaxID=1885344 RepID=UPI003B526C39
MADRPLLLSVSAAAERLGVHVGTVRRWTDDGRLPEVRTAGGHRRIPVEAVERLRRERGAPEPSAPAHVVADPEGQAWAEHAVVHTRYEVRSNADAPWNRAFEGADRSHRRETGRQLVGLLLRHVADQGDPEARDAEVRRLAWGYALDMKDRGLPLTEALRATLFFRDVLTESTAYYPRFEEQPQADQIALMRRVNGFMNDVQLTIASAYESDAPPALER